MTRTATSTDNPWDALRALADHIDRWEASGAGSVVGEQAMPLGALASELQRLRATTAAPHAQATVNGNRGLADLYEDPIPPRIPDGLIESMIERVRNLQRDRGETQASGDPTPVVGASETAAPTDSPGDPSTPLEQGPSTAILTRVPITAGPWRRVAGEVVTAVGLLVLLVAAYSTWGTGLAQADHQRSVDADFQARLEQTIAASRAAAGSEQDSGFLGEAPSDGASGSDGTAVEPPAAPGFGDPVALLSLPTIGVRTVVVSGTRPVDLERGPGHLRSTPWPGRAGNAVIFGRRTTFGGPFADIDDLQPGDPIDATTTQGVFRYVVQEVARVEDGDPDLIGASTFSNRLTLVTSDGKWSTTGRIVVWGYLDREPVPSPTLANGRAEPLVSVGDDELGAGRSRGDWARTILFSQLLVAAYIGARWLYRRWLPWSSWLVSTPIMIVIVFAWLDGVVRLFPSVL